MKTLPILIVMSIYKIIRTENISHTKIRNLLSNFPVEIQKGLLEGRLELVDSEHFFIKPINSAMRKENK